MPHVYVRPIHVNETYGDTTIEPSGPFAYLHLNQTISAQSCEVKQRQTMRRQTNALLDSIELSDAEHDKIDQILKDSLSHKYCVKCSGKLDQGNCPFC
jgi:nucleosome binding factor SPN SPT16 subunit